MYEVWQRMSVCWKHVITAPHNTCKRFSVRCGRRYIVDDIRRHWCVVCANIRAFQLLHIEYMRYGQIIDYICEILFGATWWFWFEWKWKSIYIHTGTIYFKLQSYYSFIFKYCKNITATKFTQQNAHETNFSDFSGDKMQNICKLKSFHRVKELYRLVENLIKNHWAMWRKSQEKQNKKKITMIL